MTATSKRTNGNAAVTKRLLDDIMELGFQCNIVSAGNVRAYKNYESCCNSINNYAKKYGYPLKARIWGTTITVYRTDAEF